MGRAPARKADVAAAGATAAANQMTGQIVPAIMGSAERMNVPAGQMTGVAGQMQGVSAEQMELARRQADMVDQYLRLYGKQIGVGEDLLREYAPARRQALATYSGIAAGNRPGIQKYLAPQLNMVAQQYDAARRAISAMPPGGAKDQAMRGLVMDYARARSGVMTGGVAEGTSQLANLGSGGTGLGLSALGQGAGTLGGATGTLGAGIGGMGAAGSTLGGAGSMYGGVGSLYGAQGGLYGGAGNIYGGAGGLYSNLMKNYSDQAAASMGMWGQLGQAAGSLGASAILSGLRGRVGGTSGGHV